MAFKSGFGRPIDQLGYDGLTLGDLASPAIFDDDDWLAQRLVQQGRQVLRSARSPSRVAGPTQLETGVAGWLAIADLIVALVVSRHRLPPPRRRGHQRYGRLPRDAHSRRSAPASGE